MSKLDKAIQDVCESWELALRAAGVSEDIIKECRLTVDDAICNNMN